jgi:hypothetical protein
MKLITQQDVREARKAAYRTRSATRRAALMAAIAEAETRAVPCHGEAHANPNIDNCAICAPFWGKRMPE